MLAFSRNRTCLEGSSNHTKCFVGLGHNVITTSEPRKIIWHNHTKVFVMIAVCDVTSIDRILEWGYKFKIWEKLNMNLYSSYRFLLMRSHQLNFNQWLIIGSSAVYLTRWALQRSNGSQWIEFSKTDQTLNNEYIIRALHTTYIAY